MKNVISPGIRTLIQKAIRLPKQSNKSLAINNIQQFPTVQLSLYSIALNHKQMNIHPAYADILAATLFEILEILYSIQNCTINYIIILTQQFILYMCNVHQ